MFRFSKQSVASAVVTFSILFLLGTSSLSAQSDQGLKSRSWGVGQPRTAADLPPGQLRRKLENLPPQANAKALKWLQGITFTSGDLESLHVDDEGGVLFIDDELNDSSGEQEAPNATTSGEIPQSTLNDAFNLHSKPGAPNVVYLDFSGHTITNTAWNSGALATYVARAFDLDGNPTNFNTDERTRIVDIWHRVSEDLAAFNINVTTQEPTSFNSKTGRLLITHSIDTNGNNMPHDTAGGVAYVNVFGASNYASYYSPALIYYNRLGNGSTTSVAEASSHEFGHNLGLSHDGSATTSYYTGHGSDLVSWAPIMGVGYYRNVTQWSKGEYSGANNTQDDLLIISGKLGYRTDDHGNTISTGTSLAVAADGTVLASNPQFDPDNILPENKGYIHNSTDVDVFTFGAGAGTVNLTVRPAWDAFYRATSNRGANLDVKVELRNAAGNLLTSNDPGNDTMATINYTVATGTYHLLISGVGNTTSPYSNYASHGMYFINGTVPPASADTTAPTPNPMSFSSLPAAIGESAISMTASIATDDTSSVQYRFNCTSGGAGCTNSAWQSSRSYTASSLAAATQYTFSVTARDSSGNQTTASVPASATTNVAQPTPMPVAPASLSANGVSASQINLSWSHSGSNEEGFRIERRLAGVGNFAAVANLGVNATSFSDAGLQANTSYDYRVFAYNSSGEAMSNVATNKTAALSAMSLNASGSKQKGAMVISLSWSGATNIDVFRNGSKIATVASGTSYTDKTGKKGSGTWTHRICAAGSTSNCSNTTTTVF